VSKGNSFVSEPALPPWVRKRDGRVVPFDPDAISQDLFAAAETLGSADPFLTRELTDGVLHFLAVECTDSIPNTPWINDLVIKVVRELRHPRLAQAFSERLPEVARRPAPPPASSPAEVVRRGLETYCLSAVFSRDLAAAHRDGLLLLAGLEAPREIAAAVLSPPEPSATLQALQLLDAVLEARGGVAGWLAIDGAEYLELEKGSPPLPRLLLPVLQAAKLMARLHLNAAEPPPWSMASGHGPLFAEHTAKPLADPLIAATGVVQAIFALEHERCPFAIDWHLGERDFTAENNAGRNDLLQSMALAALGEYPITFVFDRPRRPFSLGPGLDRLHSYLLMAVGLHLPCLLEHVGRTADSDSFLRKLASLARLAVSAGVQKRHFVRETLHDEAADRSFLQRGFLLDRARVMVTPLGLDAVARTVTGSGLHEGKTGLDFARRLLQTLNEVLAAESQRRLVDCVLDTSESVGPGTSPTSARQQLNVISRLQAVSLNGTALVTLDDEERLSVDQVIRLLEFAWRQTEITRLRFQPRESPQLSLGF
jgi:hypothetical protein